MTTTHIPVLAGELIDLLDPRPGEIAVDCTVRRRRPRAADRRPDRAGRDADRDRPRPGRRGALRRAGRPRCRCQTRFIRADFVTALRELLDERLRADLVYLDLGMSSMQVDTWARGFSYAYDAPLDMRMDPDQELTAEEIVNTWDERRLARLLREYGEERYAGQIARAIVRVAAPRASSSSTQQLVDAIKARGPGPGPVRRRPSRPADLPGAADRRQRRARPARRGASRRPGSCSRPGGRLAAISFHSLEDRRVKRFLAARARGCICPPELPICVCGHEPEAELLTRRAVAPTPGEVAANPSPSRRTCAPPASWRSRR